MLVLNPSLTCSTGLRLRSTRIIIYDFLREIKYSDFTTYEHGNLMSEERFNFKVLGLK